MTRYKKLFERAEIEYITPFLKLWMSFNSWYKKEFEIMNELKKIIDDNNSNQNINSIDDLKNHDHVKDNDKMLKYLKYIYDISDIKKISNDRQAIDYFKERGKIRDNFLKLFEENSDEGIEFQTALYGIIHNLENYPLKNHKCEAVNYLKDDGTNIILEHADRRGGKSPIYICQKKERYQILEEDKELFFKKTLEIIYCIRNSLVHGDFDLENVYGIGLIENSYKILRPIMERIILYESDD